MKIRMDVVDIVNGREVKVGMTYCGLSEYLDTVIVDNLHDMERVIKTAEAWERFEYRATQVEFTQAQQQDLRQIIGMRPEQMRVIEHQPQKAISQQRTSRPQFEDSVVEAQRRRHD